MDIKIIKQIIAGSFGSIRVPPGVYEAHLNQNGAVSIKNSNNELVGVKLDEFVFLSEKDREDWIKIAHPNIPDVEEKQDETDQEALDGLAKIIAEHPEAPEIYSILYLVKLLGHDNVHDCLVASCKEKGIELPKIKEGSD